MSDQPLTSAGPGGSGIARQLQTSVLDRVAARLAETARQPLEFCPDFPEIAGRWEAWWCGQADRPLLLAHVRRSPETLPGKAFSLLSDPDAYLDFRRRQMEDTHFVSEGLAFLRVDMGPNTLATFLGTPWHIDDESVTTWHVHHLEDEDNCWESSDPIVFDRDHPWLKQLLATTQRVARDAAGRYLVVLPDLCAGIDLLVAMRGPARLCLDLLEQRDGVRKAAEETVRAWAEVYRLLCETIVDAGAGYMLWHNIWSEKPYDIPACDFSTMIGPKDFEEVCLPAIRLQADAAPRTCFHLDGPGCARHIDALLAVESIDAIQYTPGAGSPSALAQLDLLKKIQDAGKSLIVFPPAGEVRELARKLDRRRLALWVQSVDTPAAADELAAAVTDFHSGPVQK